MAKKKQTKKPAAGGGRTANSEPRIQTFTQFGGCNFQLSPRDFQYDTGENDQSDLMMNFMVVQNNCRLTENKTFETRQNIEELFEAPAGEELTDICALVQDELYVATKSKKVVYGKLGETLSGRVDVRDVDGEEKDGTWTFLGYADDQLVGMTKGRQLWTAPLGTHSLENAKTVPTPPALAYSDVKAGGSLKISPSITADCPFRITLRYTHLNKYGPTLPSPALVLFASKPTTEWSGSAYLTISKTAPSGYGIVAVELYYTEDEYQDPAFLARVDLASRDGGQWTYNWTGYLFDTSMWTIANLSMPTENYTPGVPASKMTQQDGRLYFWGGDPEYRLWIGGNPGNLFSVSTGVGGGFCDVEPGTGQTIRVVSKYKTQSGNAIITVMCDNPNSTKEYRHNLLENNITLSNEQSTKGWQTEKISNTVGCKSYYGAGVWGDGLYAVSRYGLALTTMTMEYNSQIRVQYVSGPIEPAFVQKYGNQLAGSVLLCANDVIYMTFGAPDGTMDNVVFCYDINLKAWWTYSLDVDEPILNMIHIDHQDHREGIGIVTPKHVYLLPTTQLAMPDVLPTFDVLIETGELGNVQPLQNMLHLTQMEFRFDWFIGDLEVQLIGIDQFGRKITTTKRIRHDEVQHNLTEYMRVDMKLESYKMVFKGRASFRMTHWMAKTYPMSNRNGIVWGFDSAQGHHSSNDIHRYFKDYNDVRLAVIP